jgi:hypothetical protein
MPHGFGQFQVYMSVDDGESRWQQLAKLAAEAENAKKRFAIVRELCNELAALEKQLLSPKAQPRKRRRKESKIQVIPATWQKARPFTRFMPNANSLNSHCVATSATKNSRTSSPTKYNSSLRSGPVALLASSRSTFVLGSSRPLSSRLVFAVSARRRLRSSSSRIMLAATLD